MAGHRAKNPGGHGSHYVKGHWAHNPGSSAHKAPAGFPKHSQKGPKITLPKFPKHIQQQFPRKGVLTPFVWPGLTYDRVGNWMGEGRGSITALMEGEDVASQIFDRSEETFIRTEDADGNPIVPTIDVDPRGFFGDIGSTFPVNRRIGELTDLIGRESGIKGLIDEVAKTLLGDGTGKFYPNNIMASGLQVLAREGVKHFKAQIERIKRRDAGDHQAGQGAAHRDQEPALEDHHGGEEEEPQRGPDQDLAQPARQPPERARSGSRARTCT